MSWSFSCFLLGVLISGLIFKFFNPFWLDFCAWCKMVILFHYFIFDCPVFPSLFFEETVLGTLVKGQATINVWVYFWAVSCVPLVYVLVFMTVSYCFHCYSCVICFGIRKCDAISVPSHTFRVHIDFRIVFSMSVKYTIGVLIGNDWICRLLWIKWPF